MEEGKGAHPMMIGVVVALVVGLAGGYYYGVMKGKAMAVADQAKAAEVATQDAQKQIADQANPFGTETKSSVNPFTDKYENPFSGGGFNPFAQ